MSQFISRKFNQALSQYLHAAFYTNAGTVIEDVEFTGSGLDDLSTSGTYVAPVAAQTTKYTAVITTAGTPDIFKWSDDGGTTWTESVSITGSPQALNNGVYISFAATTGHTENDQWDLLAAPATPIRVYVTQTVDQIFLKRIKLPAYILVVGGQNHFRKDDCETEYMPTLVAVTGIYGLQDAAFGQPPRSRFACVNDMIDNLKPYLSGTVFYAGMSAQDYAQTVINAEWREIEAPGYVSIPGENNSVTEYLMQVMHLYFKVR